MSSPLHHEPDGDTGGHSDGRIGDRPGKVILLAALAVGIGAIGVFSGFAAVLGTAATASGAYAEDFDYAGVLVPSILGILLGLGLWTCAYLLWRGDRRSLWPMAALLVILVLTTLWRMAADAISFVSVIGTVLSLGAIGFTLSLVFSDEVREFVRR